MEYWGTEMKGGKEGSFLNDSLFQYSNIPLSHHSNIPFSAPDEGNKFLA
jgi:hypothetical protein